MGADDVTALLRFYDIAGESIAEMNANPDARADLRGALERGELPRTEAMLDAFDPEVAWAPLEAEGKVFHGRTGMVSILEAWYEAMVDWRVEPEEIVDGGDLILLTVRVRARGRSSGALVEERGYAVFKMRDGKVLRCDEYADIHTAREAAGLPSAA
jgi:ketosteroid isomerase-like protein